MSRRSAAPPLTVLTRPAMSRSQVWYRRVRRTLRPLVKPGAPPPAEQPYPGHAALVRSVVQGLRTIEVPFNFNPDRADEIGRVVYAPANEALLQAVELKKRQRIDRLVAGPVNALFPDERDGILLHPEIDVLVIASDWVRQLYADRPALAAKLRVCPVGVDTDFWQPDLSHPTGHVVVFWKDAPESWCLSVEDALRRRGEQVVRVRYGEYEATAYKRALDGARFAVVLSTFETQGLALAEAWSMNVPTLVWDPQALTTWRGRRFVAGSSCPYLTHATGRRWKTLDELEQLLERADEAAAGFSPRAWVIAHMSDAVCASALYDIIHPAADRGIALTIPPRWPIP